jgi:tetratricopeptide (TPR) repeat protein
MAKRSTKSARKKLADHLARGEASGLIGVAQLEPELEYLFRHALVQDAAYASLLKQDRRVLHRTVGAAIEKLYSDRLDEMAPLLAKHFDEGGDTARALHYYVQAGDQAGARYANGEAIMAYTRALQLVDKGQENTETLAHLFTRKGRAEELSGRYDDALATYEALEEVGRSRDDRSLELAALSAQATVYSTFTSRADPEKGMALSEKAQAIARQIGDEPALSKILWNLMLVSYTLNNPGDGLRYAEEALEIARRLNLREQLAFTLHDFGNLLVATGDFERSQAMREEARALWRELDNKAMLADNLVNSAQLLVLIGAYHEARRLVEESLHITQSIGNPWGQSFAYIGLLNIDFALGELGQSIHACQESIRLAELAGFGFPLVAARCLLAAIIGYLGQPDRGLEYVDAARILTREELPTLAAVPAIVEISLRMAQGDLARAESLLNDPAIHESPGDPTPMMILSAYHAQLCIAQGDPQQAIRVADGLLAALPPQLHGYYFVCQAKIAKGRALTALSDLAGARETLEQVMGVYRATGAHLFRWETLAALAEVALAEGNRAEADQHRVDARHEIEYLIERIGDAGLEESFRARPEVRALLEG